MTLAVRTSTVVADNLRLQKGGSVQAGDLTLKIARFESSAPGAARAISFEMSVEPSIIKSIRFLDEGKTIEARHLWHGWYRENGQTLYSLDYELEGSSNPVSIEIEKWEATIANVPFAQEVTLGVGS